MNLDFVFSSSVFHSFLQLCTPLLRSAKFLMLNHHQTATTFTIYYGTGANAKCLSTSQHGICLLLAFSIRASVWCMHNSLGKRQTFVLLWQFQLYAFSYSKHLNTLLHTLKCVWVHRKRQQQKNQHPYVSLAKNLHPSSVYM